jgi:hypothetical protein
MGNADTNWIATVGARQQSGLGLVSLRKSASGTSAYLATAERPVAVDTKRMSVQHVLITKSQDLQGDIVDPVGADLSTHESNPVVFYDHREHYKHPIAAAKDGNRYTVTKSRNGELLYAETFFSPKDEMSNQLFGLCAEDLIRGWSVGFNPKPGGFETIRKSVGGRDRGAFRFNQYTLLEYSLTPQPVNPDALTVLVEKGRFGSEPLNQVILKSLTPLVSQPRLSLARVPDHPLTRKAMNDEMPNGAAPDADPYADPDAQGADDGPAELPTPAALYDAAQGLMDLCGQLTQSLQASEHKGGRSFAESICALLQKAAGKCKAKADAIKSELAGESEDDAEPADGDEPDADDDEVETDDDGGIVTKGGYRPKRWTTKGIQLANRVTRRPSDDARYAALESRLDDLLTKLPAA